MHHILLEAKARIHHVLSLYDFLTNLRVIEENAAILA